MTDPAHDQPVPATAPPAADQSHYREWLRNLFWLTPRLPPWPEPGTVPFWGSLAARGSSG